MKKEFIIFLLLVAMSTHAKTTYIPTYRSYLHIVNGSDTTAVENNLEDLELSDANGMFTLRIEHEEVTEEKVRDIKRAKRAAGMMSLSAVMSGISTAFSNNSLQYMVRSKNTELTATLADIYTANAEAEQLLTIDLWLDNTSNSELMICDIERGLTWWVLPNQSIRFKLNNPEASRLRISDPKNDHVRYVSAMAGSKVTKYEIKWEDDTQWIRPIFKKPSNTSSSYTLAYYLSISKIDYTETVMSIEQYNELIKEQKKANR